MTGTAPAQDRRFGSGWISGAIAAVLGPMSFGAVLCLRFPQQLTSPHLREVYPMGFMRGLIHHGHHSPRAEALDRNFAIHLPWIDRLFGTLYLPGEE